MKTFAAGSGGATVIEYALIASLISIVIVGSATAIGTKLRDDFNGLQAIWQ